MINFNAALTEAFNRKMKAAEIAVMKSVSTAANTAAENTAERFKTAAMAEISYPQSLLDSVVIVEGATVRVKDVLTGLEELPHSKHPQEGYNVQVKPNRVVHIKSAFKNSQGFLIGRRRNGSLGRLYAVSVSRIARELLQDIAETERYGQAL